MIYETSYTAIGVFAFFVAVVLGISFYLGAKAKSASGYYAAHGQIPWFVNGIAFAGDYLSAASFLGICGMIAFYGYDGFLYSIGFLAGWTVALLVIAEPLKRLGKFTFADALDSQFNSRGIKLAASISTLVVSVFYLIPQMVGAGALVKPLLGLSHETGVVTVGVVVILIVVTAGMVSTTWVQFIKGGMLVIFCAILTVMILIRGFGTSAGKSGPPHPVPIIADPKVEHPMLVIPETGGWVTKPYVRTRGRRGESDETEVWRKLGANEFALCQTLEVRNGIRYVNSRVQTRGPVKNDFFPVGEVRLLPGNKTETGPLDPMSYISTLQQSDIVTWRSEKILDADGITTVFYPQIVKGNDLLTPGASPTFGGIRSDSLWKKLDFLSLMIALFCGTASHPSLRPRLSAVESSR